MARQLVVCLDGTGNRFSHTPTNILRLRRSFDSPNVLAYYDQGVGTFGLKETLFEWQKVPSRVCGLAFGWGLKRTVQSAYALLAENYRSDDEIYLFGFSRGAYTARALAALIYACGLVEPHQLNMFDYAWAMLLARKKVAMPLGQPAAAGPSTAPQPKTTPDWSLQRSFKDTFGREVSIKFMGLFDTVKSVGWVYDPTVIPYTAKNPIVETVRHAQSIDESRCFFRQNSWSEDPAQRTDVKQVWFPGVHSDIGGGYDPSEGQLSSVALCWMAGEAIENGLFLDRNLLLAEMRMPHGVPPDMLADMHNSMSKGWKVAEWLPTYVWNSGEGKRRLGVGSMPPFGNSRPRTIPENCLVHVSLKKRLLERPDYRPPNLPTEYTIINDSSNSPCT